MYNEKINTANKIISDKLLLDIFALMYEEKIKCEKQYEMEKRINDNTDYLNQKWTLNLMQTSLTFNVNFSDSTNITFDKYDNFVSIFNKRLHEIKSIFCYYNLSYFDNAGKSRDNHIYLNIFEDNMDIDVSLNSEDDFMNNIFNFIKEKIKLAPEKYDYVIKKKNKIINTYSFSLGAIAGIILTSLLLLISPVRTIVLDYFIIYPLICLFLSFIVGTLVFSGKMTDLYKCIDMEKIYDGYDMENNKSIYKDDKQKYMNTSEVIIGKNIDNLKNREEIKMLEGKFKKFIPYELLCILIISLLIFVVGIFI